MKAGENHEQRQRRCGQTGCNREHAEPAVASPGDDETDDENRESEVLLHEQQGQSPVRRGGQPVIPEGGQRERQERHGERHFVEVVADSTRDSPGEAVAGTDHRAYRAAQGPACPESQRDDAHGEERGLHDEECFRSPPHPVERRHEREDGREVIPEDGKVLALHFGDRQVSFRV